MPTYRYIKVNVHRPPLNTIVIFFNSNADREEPGSIGEYEFTASGFMVYKPEDSARIKSYADYWRQLQEEEDEEEV